MEFLRDPIWQFLGAIIGVAGIFVSYVIFRRQQPQKQIAYEIITNTPLIRVTEDLEKKLTITFEGKPTQSITLLILRIINLGKVSILPPEFERPIRVKFGKNVEILESDIFKVIPENISPEVRKEANCVELLPLLLNSGDEIYIKLLLTKFDNQLSVEGRIAGVKNIESIKNFKTPIASFLESLILIFIGTIISTASIIIGFITWKENNDSPQYLGIFYLLLGLIMLSIIVYGVFDTYKSIKRALG